jgi:hypothetical protein
VGHLAFVERCEVHELSREPDDLERLFLQMTAEPREGGTP